MATAARQPTPSAVQWIEEARRLPAGARFFQCALQVNPFAYLERHRKETPYRDAAAYDTAIVQACLTAEIEAIAVTDHYRVRTGASLLKAAEARGVAAFPGFEAVTKDGVHLLCLFERGTPLDEVDRAIGDCGIHSDEEDSPIGDYDALELLEKCREWCSVCVAAHVTSSGGLLRQLSGQARVRAWRSPDLVAVVIPGAVDGAPEDLRAILQNKDPAYRRDRLPAVLNAKDVSAPEDLADAIHSCSIKMSEVSLAGLRQAFLDPDSRVRLASDPPLEERTQITAIRWDGGFLDGASMHLNDNLNVLIGGRGAGKSTVIESLRYVLDLEPVGEDARREHEGIVRHVLGSGTRVAVLVRSHRPSPADYVVERTVPNPPTVRDAATGQVLDLSPDDVAPQTDVYGQHEISELAKSPDNRTRLLGRFVERDPGLDQKKDALVRDLEESRQKVLNSDRELERSEERLAALPGFEETLRRFQKAGVEERLKERSLLVGEQRTIETASERTTPFSELLAELRDELPIDRAFVSKRALEALPGRQALEPLDAVLADLDRDLDAVARALEEALGRGQAGIAEVRRVWDERRQEVEAAYQKILRELQKSNVDGAEFIQLRQQIEELRPLRDRLSTLRDNRTSLGDRRRDLLVEWEDSKAEEFRGLERAAKRVTKRLQGRVRVRVTYAADREPLFDLLREQIGGRLIESCDALRGRPELSLTELADACRVGSVDLTQRFKLPASQAQRIADASPEVVMRIEELNLPSLTEVELNVAREGEPEAWRQLDELSTGQKATAILLLLLLESDAPLIVDQPEDDLDNRFITEGVVPRMREEKRRRQFVFATHNANIPVLGDAELIVGLSATGEAEEGQAQVPPNHMGSIDIASVRDLVEELLEGGREAFELRRLKYGF